MVSIIIVSPAWAGIFRAKNFFHHWILSGAWISF
nr:MAG TPA: hypothetical protein [Caudoviricetes sp.]